MNTSITRKPRTAPPADRINAVFDWILAGRTDFEIEQAIAATWPDQDTKPLIIGAMRRVERAGQPDQQIVRGWCIESARALYSRAIEANDFSAGIAAIKLINSLSQGAR